MNQTNSIIMIQNDHLEWLLKHPERFVNNLATRLNAGEIDKHPGYARWSGDGMPGIQVAWVGKSDFCGVIVVGNNCATRLGTAIKVKNDNSQESKEEILKQLASQLGYILVKKKIPGNKPGAKNKKLATV
jgi:hypothetical protein